MRRIYSLFSAFIIIFSMPLTCFATQASGIATVVQSSSAMAAATDIAIGTVSGNDAAVGSGQTSQPSVIVEQLRIDSKTLYDGMDKTYEQGYIPKVENGKVSIVLPLLGKTYDGYITVIANLGATADNPFILGNYSQTVSVKDGSYLFHFEIPLASGRKNGAYPVTLTADYLDITGNQAQQSFILYVTIMDGINADTCPTKEAVETPKLYISACELTPETVGGEEEFSVTVTIENIGAIRARSVILTYGSDTTGIVPSQTNNTMHLENIASGKSETASFAFQTTTDVLAGEQSFYVKLDYMDLYGGVYTENRTFLVQVIQPAKMEYDPIRIPKQVTSGETISVPVSVFNTGKSTLRNVVATISGSGLIPTSSVFFGDILPGESGNGELEFYVGTLSMTDNISNDYGKSNGTYTITYTDDSGEEHKEEMDFQTEIMRPVEDSEDITEEKTVGQWWISILVALAIIAIVVSVIVVTKFSRMLRMK